MVVAEAPEAHRVQHIQELDTFLWAGWEAMEGRPWIFRVLQAGWTYDIRVTQAGIYKAGTATCGRQVITGLQVSLGGSWSLKVMVEMVGRWSG